MKPKVLILDEPAVGLDPMGKRNILDKIAEIKAERNCTVILVSHSMDDIADYVNRVWVLDDGKLIIDASVKEVFSHKRDLEEIGLAVPQITSIMHMLKDKGLVVNTNVTTIDEAKMEILRKLR